jgi:hypothetical protein
VVLMSAWLANSPHLSVSEPPPEDLQALEQMIRQQQWFNAEIAARMMVNNYPS